MSEAYDVIVVGAGTAGIPCAIEAARGGLQVLLLEKSADIGGTLHVSGGHMSAAGTRRQASHGLKDSVELHVADVLRISGGTAPVEFVRLAASHAAATVDWLDENGFDFSPDTPITYYGHDAYGVARTYYGKDAGRSILAVLRRLLDQEVRPGRVTLRLGTPAEGLITEGNRVVGVVCGDRDSRASAVVLASGGYGSNPELFKELEGKPLFSSTVAAATGDGLRLAQSIGASVARTGSYLPTFGGIPDEAGDPVRVPWRERPRLVAQERTPWEIYVDLRGRRFIAEDEPSMDRKERALLGLDRTTFWMICDDRAVDESSPMVGDWSADSLRQRANRRAGVHSAQTLAAVAALAGIDPDGLMATVAEYNQGVRMQSDALGRRLLLAPIDRRPYYAIRNHGTSLLTFGGIAVDIDLRVQRADGSTIDGLFAAGEVIGAATLMGNSFCGGMSVTPALTFGRLIGQRLARAQSKASDAR